MNTINLPSGRKVEVTTAAEAVEAQVADILAAFETVRAAGNVEDVPDPATTERWLRSMITAQGGRVRFLRQSRKNATEDERAALAMFRWHSGNGSLWGPMEWRFRLGEETFGQVETFSTILVVYGRGRSRAVEAWKRTGLVK